MQLSKPEQMGKMLFTQSRSYTLILLFCSFACVSVAHTYSYVSDGYLKAVEMDWGDTLVYELKSGQMRTFVLQKTAAEPAYIYDLPENQWRSGCIYRMQATLLCEGQPLTLHRIVSAQQSYYEPYHINGVTIFFDAVNDIEDFIKDNHGSKGMAATACGQAQQHKASPAISPICKRGDTVSHCIPMLTLPCPTARKPLKCCGCGS